MSDKLPGTKTHATGVGTVGYRRLANGPLDRTTLVRGEFEVTEASSALEGTDRRAGQTSVEEEQEEEQEGEGDRVLPSAG